jgi:hypothetical protein
MTTYERAVGILTDTIAAHRQDEPVQLARRCLEAMRAKRITPQTFRASEEMFVRFHAHCRHLGAMTGKGYRHYYNESVRHSMATDDWPVKIVTRRIKLDTGQVVEVDVPVPESSTKATTRALMAAYTVIEDEARRAGVRLPENPL